MLAFLHDTTSLDRQLHLHCFYFRTWTERDCGSHLPATERPPVDVPFGVSHRSPPAQATPHVLHAWNAHECSKKAVRTGRKVMFRYMSPSVSCDLRVCWTSAYRKVRHSTVHVSSRTAQRFTILHSPARPHPASTSFSFSLSLQPQPCTSARLSAR
jgi:hypothetical protein